VRGAKAEELLERGLKFGNKKEKMGATQSQLEQLAQLEAQSIFTQQELQRLLVKFRKLDTDGSGSLSVDEFFKDEEIRNNPLAKRVISIFDEDNGGDVDFEEFVKGLSIFSTKSEKKDKLMFAFKIYDIDRDGFISNGELFQVLKMMTGDNLKDAQLQQIVDKTIMEADKDGDGKIGFEEFCSFVEKTDIHLQLTVNVN